MLQAIIAGRLTPQPSKGLRLELKSGSLRVFIWRVFCLERVHSVLRKGGRNISSCSSSILLTTQAGSKFGVLTSSSLPPSLSPHSRIPSATIILGPSSSTSAAEVSSDVAGGEAEEHKALWETGGICLHGYRGSSRTFERKGEETALSGAESKGKCVPNPRQPLDIYFNI